jgi:transposase
MFEKHGGGRPEIYSRRRLVDAISYVVRSGCSWRMLPKDFPPWQNVYATFRRWAAKGLLERMHDRLCARWRERLGREAAPTAGVIDSQSVKTSERGGPRGTMPGRRSKAASATS